MPWLLALCCLLAVPFAQAATVGDDPSARPRMVPIPAGEFLMGSPEDEPDRDDDERRHRVTLTRDFLIAATEVSQALYQDVTGVNPSRRPGADHPVESVTWYDCIRFCNLLSDRDGLEPAYEIIGEQVIWDTTAEGYRLPTEAEWEYACRAGTTTAYGFGDDADRLHSYANYDDQSDSTRTDGHADTAPVGSYAPNGWGLYDMLGNVWEWCWDWWAPHTPDDRVDPEGPAHGREKVEKGGCWLTDPDMCRPAYRHYFEPYKKRSYVGFRVVRTVVDPLDQLW